MYQFPLHIKNKARETVLITGSARSGTSIFGKLLGSLEGVEYFFEPPTLFSLFSLLEAMPRREVQFLFDTFVYEELLMGALSGRAINLRGQDDSSIRHIKTEKEIARRLDGVARKHELDASAATIAIKIPSFVNRIPAISETLGLHRLVISIRHPGSTINSLLRKGWFSDTTLQAGDIIWPNRVETRVPAPHWVPEEWLGDWDSMAETDRAALYFITQTDLPHTLPKNTLIFDYDQMIIQSRELLEVVADQLDLRFGPLTEKILADVKVQETTEQYDLDFLSNEFRKRVLEVYAQARARLLVL